MFELARMLRSHGYDAISAHDAGLSSSREEEPFVKGPFGDPVGRRALKSGHPVHTCYSGAIVETTQPVDASERESATEGVLALVAVEMAPGRRTFRCGLAAKDRVDLATQCVHRRNRHGWLGIAIFLVLVFRKIFIFDESMSKGQMLLKYWPVLAVAVVAGVVGDMAKRTEKNETASQVGVIEGGQPGE